MRSIILLVVTILFLSFIMPVKGLTYHTITCDGNLDDWSDDEGMGTINSATFYVTFDFYNIYFAFHRGSNDNDMFIALDSMDGGSNRSLDWYGTHTLPFYADFYVGIENESYAYLFRYNGSGWERYIPLKDLGSYISDSNVNIELKIPLKILGYPKSIGILAYGQWEYAINVWAVWPVTNPMGIGTQNFTNYISLPVKEGIEPADYRYGVHFPMPKFNIDGYLTDWSGDANLTKVEDSSEDSAGDLEGVVENEVYYLYVSWDDNYLYVGYEYRTGVWGDSVYDNGTMIFIDASSPWSDGTTTFENMNVWPRKINFANFRCEFFYGKWDEQKGNFYHVISQNYSTDITSQVIIASTGGNGVRGDVELAIPWRILYGTHYRSIMYNITGIKISLAVVGHDNETALDTVPDVGDVTKNTNFTDSVTIDYFLNTGKIFSPPPLSIENLTYNLKNSQLHVSWSTNHPSKCILTYEHNGSMENFTFNFSREFEVTINNASYGNLTIDAYDVYGNHARKSVAILPPGKGNAKLETMGRVSKGGFSPILLSLIIALAIISGGEIYLWLRRKKGK